MKKIRVGDPFKFQTHGDKRRRIPATTWTGYVNKENAKSYGLVLVDDKDPNNRWSPLLDKRTGKLR
jgi:hypothetical protein